MKIIKQFFILLMVASFAFNACSDDSDTPVTKLEIDEKDLNLSYPADNTIKMVAINSDIDDIQVSSNQSWCKALYEKQGTRRNVIVSVTTNEGLDVRTAAVVVKAGAESKTINVTQLGQSPAIIIKNKSFSAGFKAQPLSVVVTTNVELDVTIDGAWMKVQTNKAVGLVDRNFDFAIEQLPAGMAERVAKVKFTHKGGKLADSVFVRQSLTPGDSYVPGSSASFEKDKKIRVVSAQLSPSDKFQSGEGIENTIDGNHSTIYHSPWSGMTANTPITLEYTLDADDAQILNYVVLQPRTSGGNGIIKTATVWATTATDGTYKEVGNVSASYSNNPVIVRFATPIIAPRKIKVVVTDAYTHDEGKYYVSLAEFECYESKAVNALGSDGQYFTDLTFSELKPGVTIDDIANIKNPFIQNIAVYLLAGKYNTDFRVENYEAYRPVDDLAKELKTSTYSQFENPTGIYFKADEEVVVFVGDTHGESVMLRVKDWGKSGSDNTYPLSTGLNVLKMKGKGNGYVSYYTKNYKSAANIKIHFASGAVNGYFDIEKHSNEDGKKLLDNAVSEIMDIRCTYVQLAYAVSSLKANCYEQMYDLAYEYDRIVNWQYTTMGLQKYNRQPKNRMFGRVIWEGFMHADGTGAAFHDNTMGTVANVNNVKTSGWGIAHEFGHVNQVRPGMRWIGTVEVTNNIYSVWTQFQYTPHSMRLETENIGGDIGGRFNAYLNNGLIKKQEWGLQGGPDFEYGTDEKGNWRGDHFVKLAPIWQLMLYYQIAGEGNSWHKEYFWQEIFEKVRTTNDANFTNGEHQVNFVKNMCDAVQEDLSDFFIACGMLTEIDKSFDDYGAGRKTITKSMIDQTVAYVSKYPKPQYDFRYISVNSYEAFKYRKAVSGQKNVGVSGTGTVRTISHSEWKNVVMFETYKGDELVKLSMPGTGDASNSSTKVSYPEGSTRIEAVAFDGQRTLVAGSR